MNRKYMPIIAFSLALILVGSVAYAADRKKKLKATALEPGELSEESLKAELLGVSDAPARKSTSKTPASAKSAGAGLVESKVK